MRLKLTVLLLIAIVPFMSSFNFFQKKKTRDYADVAREIRTQVGNKLSTKHHMHLVGEGGGMMGSVYMIALHFEIGHPLDRNEARMRIIDCVDELLTTINANEEIRPYLKNYPFTTKNVQVSIHSAPLDGRSVYDPVISVVSVDENDYITFRTEEPNNFSYKHRHRELYSEAKTMVKSQPIAKQL